MHAFSQKIRYFPPFIGKGMTRVFGMLGNGNRCAFKGKYLSISSYRWNFVGWTISSTFADKFSRFFSEIDSAFTCSFVDVASVFPEFLFLSFHLFTLFSQFLLFLLENREPLLL